LEITFGILGSGTWATALAKMLTDNKHAISWCVRDQESVDGIISSHHNPKYLSSVYFDTSLIRLFTDVNLFMQSADAIVLAVPSAYVETYFDQLNQGSLKGKRLISAVKGIVPGKNVLVNVYLTEKFDVDARDFFAIMGPCHAEEVAAGKLSYLTFSGSDVETCTLIASYFKSSSLNTIINADVDGVQYAAVLKNIYAVGAGIAHGLEYGDNFQSVLIANCADEMAGFLKKVGIQHIEVGTHDPVDPLTNLKNINYAASVYLGDLLVTCYSLYSRNRTFGNMIGKGYSVKTTQLEMNMVAEGYIASKCINAINETIGSEMPIAKTIYQILWENVNPRNGFKQIETVLV
jgi:glycerol-3-phosphate dehydrogenase (NAD(P)+)